MWNNFNSLLSLHTTHIYVLDIEDKKGWWGKSLAPGALKGFEVKNWAEFRLCAHKCMYVKLVPSAIVTSEKHIKIVLIFYVIMQRSTALSLIQILQNAVHVNGNAISLIYICVKLIHGVNERNGYRRDANCNLYFIRAQNALAHKFGNFKFPRISFSAPKSTFPARSFTSNPLHSILFTYIQPGVVFIQTTFCRVLDVWEKSKETNQPSRIRSQFHIHIH